MELRNDNRPLDPKRPISLAKSARKGMEKRLDQADRSRDLRETELRAAQERIARAREAHVAQLQDLRDRSESLRGQIQDRIDLSETARALVQGNVHEDEAPVERAELIDSLKAAYQSGNLNTEERVQRAAARLLGAEE